VSQFGRVVSVAVSNPRAATVAMHAALDVSFTYISLLRRLLL
jgi:hypothetical protein